ncbi:ribosomal protein L27 [Acrasis kona]|uniref:Ribosomal protein L27 n=1 Tax=Acrasis kona TaxID=1008807 RepID=A0AAW2ZBA0_9EUKA
MGHGRVGKHRKHAGGRGNAGGQHHHRIWFDKFHPGYFGKVGMRVFHEYKYRKWAPATNVNKLWHLAGEEAYNNAKADPTKAVVVDVLNHGYSKVIGTGKIPKIPMIVRARQFSKRAEFKIRQAGGICQLRA